MVTLLKSTKMTLKKYKLLLIAGAMIATLPMTSCKKDFGDTNTNPGVTTAPVTSALLTSVLSTLAGYTWDAGGITTISGLYAQYFSETQYTDISTYSKEKADWNFYYAPSGNSFTTSGALHNLKTIIDYNTDPKTAISGALSGSNKDQIAIARILKAYIFSTLTDIYGDIPYSKALQGDNGIVPYDKQQAIYTDLFKELTEAVAQFDGGVAVSGDILFGGDETKWKQFANSIHLLMALRISKIDSVTGKTEFNKALSAGVIGTGQSIQLQFPGGNFLSPIYQYYDVTKRFDYAVSKTMTDMLKTTSDPRLTAYGTSSVGFPYGLSRDNAVAFANTNTNYAQLLKGTGASGTDPFNIITSAEIFLARAEAAQLKWTNEVVADMYATGISESMKIWNVYDPATLATYMSNPSIDLTQGTPLQKIATQEWVTHYPAGVRGWSDWRRTGFPVLAPAPAGVFPNIPRRIAYGPNEYSYNPTNVAAAAAQYVLNGDKDSQYGRIWWDVQ
jgi:Starch-binding associating with outer membrane